MKEAKKVKKGEENFLFLKQWVKNPKALGSIIPSSESLGKFIFKHIHVTPDEYIVEIGAGTGSLTQTLLHSGIMPERLIVIELDPYLYDFLKKTLPSQVTLICGDARNLPDLLPPHAKGHISTIISGIPMVNLTLEEQRQIVDACFITMEENGNLIQFTYTPLSPLPAKRLGLSKKRVGHVLMNIPPATVWKYQRALV